VPDRFRLFARLLRLLLLLLGGGAGTALAITPADDLDLNRYFGIWYEIAAVPRFLQSRCARDTRVEYAAAEQGAVAMRNYCMRADGSSMATEARGRPLEPEVPAVLKVTTVNLLGIWWYPFGREYVIVAVGPDYRWAVVGDHSMRYGRILSRKPSLDGSALRDAANAIVREGYDLCAFVVTPQSGGFDRGSRLCDVLH